MSQRTGRTKPTGLIATFERRRRRRMARLRTIATTTGNQFALFFFSKPHEQEVKNVVVMTTAKEATCCQLTVQAEDGPPQPFDNFDEQKDEESVEDSEKLPWGLPTTPVPPLPKILYADDNILAIDKPSGIPHHKDVQQNLPGILTLLRYHLLHSPTTNDDSNEETSSRCGGHEDSTCSDADGVFLNNHTLPRNVSSHHVTTTKKSIIPQCPPPAVIGRLYGVHRLDKDTSGILLFARNAPTAKILTRAFRTSSTSTTAHMSSSPNQQPFEEEQQQRQRPLTGSTQGGAEHSHGTRRSNGSSSRGGSCIVKYYTGLSWNKPKKKKQGLIQGFLERGRRKSWYLVARARPKQRAKPAKCVSTTTEPSPQAPEGWGLFCKTRFYTAGLGHLSSSVSWKKHTYHRSEKDNNNEEVFEHGKHSPPPPTLILFRPYTGRTHQLRVTAKSVGLPLAGDPIYSTSSNTQNLVYDIGRHSSSGNVPPKTSLDVDIHDNPSNSHHHDLTRTTTTTEKKRPHPYTGDYQNTRLCLHATALHIPADVITALPGAASALATTTDNEGGNVGLTIWSTPPFASWYDDKIARDFESTQASSSLTQTNDKNINYTSATVTASSSCFESSLCGLFQKHCSNECPEIVEVAERYLLSNH